MIFSCSVFGVVVVVVAGTEVGVVTDVEEIVGTESTVVFRKVEFVEFESKKEFWAFGRFCIFGPPGKKFGLIGEKGSFDPPGSFGVVRMGGGGGLWYKKEFERPQNFVSSTQHESGTGFVNLIFDGNINSTRPYF